MHVPVLLEEVVALLNIRPGGTYIDATIGGGGHSKAILERLRSGYVLGIDRDHEAVTRARKSLAEFGERLTVTHGNIAMIGELWKKSGLPLAAGMIADLGVSSWQIEDAGRGFSFDRPGPLDMRMDKEQSLTADEIVNGSQEQDLADLIFKLGEERHSRRIARAIVRARPIRTTAELAQAVRGAIPSGAGLRHLHPATRTFMALRLAVNQELENLDNFLSGALSVLAPGGRLVIISFHSLEDRRVKQAFTHWQLEGIARIVTRKVVRPGEEETNRNPRSRSAKLRAAQKAAA
ncbi:MAG: 16S rRNA (cytosine(1402)-N(4))-methyltransferase RsmH [Acidobacteriota bacterium]|nr:16S rRNA (cytosine(1402)-N(4))-methyltransferase RsmH [Acidobacteriota bacterium]